MSKPTRVPLWDVNQTNIVDPSSALVDDGYPDDDTPTASQFNYQLYWLGQWCAYVDAGEWDGNITIDGTLTVAGDIEATGSSLVGGDLQVGGNSTIDGSETIGGGLTVAGDANVYGQLNVVGDVVIGGHLQHPTESITFGFSKDLVMDIDTGTVSATPGTGGVVVSDDEQVVHWRLPLLRSYERLRSVTIYGEDADGASSTQFALFKFTPGSTTMTLIPTSGSSVLTGGSLTLTPSTTESASGTTCYVLRSVSGTHECTLSVGQLNTDVVS